MQGSMDFIENPEDANYLEINWDRPVKYQYEYRGSRLGVESPTVYNKPPSFFSWYFNKG